MKKYILFLILITASFTVNAQAEWTGDGDGYSWDDPFNWIGEEVPYDGDDVYINGGNVDFYGSLDTYESLELANGSNILIQGEMNLYGDLIVDPTSVISADISDLNDFSKVIVGGNYFFEGEVDILFSGYVPQIGNSYQVIQGNIGLCITATTDIVPENQSGGGHETFLAVQCQSNGILFTVTDINYTTAKSWDGEGGDNQWGTAANWDPNGVPTASDRVVINLPSGATVHTNTAGTTSAYLILIGDNNNLVVNGDLEMFSFISVNSLGGLNWKGGSISRTDTNVQSFILNKGSLFIDGPANKSIENGFEILSQGSEATFVITEKGFDINDGEVTVYRGNLVIDGDNITIGYTSGSQHSLRMINATSLIKSSGSGTSSINLTNFLTFSTANVICEEGTLAFGENLTNYGSLAGSGSFQLPNSHIEAGIISPGSSPGILTVIGNLTTAPEANFNIEIDGPNAGTEYDQIVVTNNAILEGTINVTLGYLPANDASFEIVTAGTLTSCNFPAQITSNYNGTDYTFDVICQNNKLYLNGPGATLSASNFDVAELKMYPNPTSKNITIDLGQNITEIDITISNILGQVITNERFVNTNTVNLSIDGNPGIYFLSIVNSEGIEKTLKIIKQ